MIKKYNQFVTGKVNEDLEPEVETTKKTLPKLVRPVPMEVPMDVEEEEEEEVKSTPSDKYEAALQSLADAANAKGFISEFDKGGKMVIIKMSEDDKEGKKVTFPAEDEQYHISGVRKGFNTVDDVLANLGGSQNTPAERREEVRDEMSSIDDESVMDSGEQFESKSYKFKRKK